jgi:ketohexokinase
MANILLTGIATLDIINHVGHFPAENEEMRILKQDVRRGGNAANSADVLQQLKHNVTLVCSLAEDNSGQFIRNNLADREIQLHAETSSATCTTPTSYIILNTTNGSRTITHYRNLAELSFDYFNQMHLETFNWFHFEGRNIQQTHLMMQKASTYKKTISVEIEKQRSDGDIHALLPLANVIMFSKPFALTEGFESAVDCLQFFSRKFPDKIISCTWGEKGAWISKSGNIHHNAAYFPTKTIDTLGAGDTYNAALINALYNNQSIEHSVMAASKLASLKCSQTGFDNLVK